MLSNSSPSNSSLEKDPQVGFGIQDRNLVAQLVQGFPDFSQGIHEADQLVAHTTVRSISRAAPTDYAHSSFSTQFSVT
jgi:hypothetical protein